LKAHDEPPDPFKVLVVALILDSRPESALKMLSDHYGVDQPKLRVGVIKGRTKGIRAVYTPRRKEILAARSEYLYDPFVIIHEFYHHLRSITGTHRGTERLADAFAIDFIKSYLRAIKATVRSGSSPC